MHRNPDFSYNHYFFQCGVAPFQTYRFEGGPQNLTRTLSSLVEALILYRYYIHISIQQAL